jgi:hypothetical protein
MAEQGQRFAAINRHFIEAATSCGGEVIRMFQLIRDLFPARCSQHQAWMRLNKPSTKPPSTADKRTSDPDPQRASIQQQREEN